MVPPMINGMATMNITLMESWNRNKERVMPAKGDVPNNALVLAAPRPRIGANEQEDTQPIAQTTHDHGSQCTCKGR